MKWSRSIVAAIACGAALLASCPRGSSTACDARLHAERFRATHSLAELQSLLPALELGLTRPRVEQLLGPPDYCPTDQQCYYSSDTRNAAGVPYGLVVDYELLDPQGRAARAVPRLESLSLMAIGE